jgi:predicted nuclease of predicted toxin-antitoxin system
VKVLLDENLPHRLRIHLGSHEVFTVRYQGWSELKNGELLRTAENNGFEVFITGDQPWLTSKILRVARSLLLFCPRLNGT